MNKIIFLLSVCFLFVTCMDDRPVTVNNNSSINTVTFTLTTGHLTKSYTVEPNNQFIYNLGVNFDHNMGDYSSYPKNDAVYFVQTGDVYDFFDIEITPIPAYIYNSLEKEVTLSGNGDISTDPLNISAGQEITTESILSKTPSFSAITIDGYPVLVNFIFDGTKFNIILR